MNNIDTLPTDLERPAWLAELADVEEAFNQAMISNDAARINDCVMDDWVVCDA